jgi:glycosyltransferase involved in cell wall biosynthesis
MKIGYDVSQTGSGKAGCGFFAYSLIQNIAKLDHANEYILYPTFGDVYWDENWAESVVSLQQPNFQKGKGHKTYADMQQFWRRPNTSFDEFLGKPDILHANNFYCPLGLNRSRLVYTLYDLGFIANPDWTTEANRTICFEGVYRGSVVSDMIVSISDHSTNHFLRLFPHYPRERIRTIYPASRFEEYHPDPNRTGPQNIEPRKFWLAVGTIEPRKNYFKLVEAYAQYKQAGRLDFPLVIAGGKGWLMENFLHKVKELGLEDDVIMLGYVDDDTLLWLYSHCYAFIYPSFFEGFGLPVLEAMSQGAAVITSKSTSLPEIVGDAALMVDPNSMDEILKAMMTISQHSYPIEQLRQASVQRSKAFSWADSARQILEVYQQVMELPYYHNPDRRIKE